MTDPIFSPSDFSQQSKTKQQVVATPLSNHAASHPVREVMDDGALDRLRGRLGAEINMLDRVLSTEEQQEVSAAQLAPLTTKASAIDFDAATIRPSPSNKRKTISPVKEHHDTVSIATRGATESAHAAIDPKQPKSLAPGWSIKILESGSGQTSAQADYKTMFVHRDATAVEVLVMALKKWYA